MKDIKFKSISISNFKGIGNLEINFNDGATTISGQNATGKTSVLDAISWILFDKNSCGDSKFELRPLDKDGNKIHHIDISVDLTVSIDGVDYVLSKVQKEKWVKKRGQEQQEYSGNVNEFSISGFPKSSKDFTAFISEIVEEKIFGLLTNPTAFPNLDWKEQRKILMSIVGEISDNGLANEVEYYELLEPELKVASIYDIKAKWAKTRNELKKKPDELQARIDEVSNSIVPDNSADLEIARDGIKLKMAENDELMKTLERKHDSREIDSKIAELRSKQRVVIADANAEKSDKIRAINGRLDDLNRKYQSATYDADKYTLGADKCKENIVDKEKQVSELKHNIEISEKATFPESNGTCDKCGQRLPEEQYQYAKTSWEKRRQDYIAKAKSLIESHEESIRKEKSNADEFAENLEKLEAKISSLADEIAKTKEELHTAQSQKEAVGTDIPEWVDIEKQIADLEASKMPDEEYQAEYAKLNNAYSELESQLEPITEQLASIAENKRKQERIAELNKELKTVGQKISDCDRMLFAIESYNKAMARRLSEKFSGLEIRLFKEQINGGSTETCELAFNGVPYGSLNSGHRILVGISIIKVLREHFGVMTPIIIDNAESLSSDNIPDVDGQLILLKVSDDKTLTIS